MVRVFTHDTHRTVECRPNIVIHAFDKIVVGLASLTVTHYQHLDDRITNGTGTYYLVSVSSMYSSAPISNTLLLNQGPKTSQIAFTVGIVLG